MQTEPNENDQQQQEPESAPVVTDVQPLEASPAAPETVTQEQAPEQDAAPIPQSAKAGPGWGNVRSVIKWSNLVIAAATVANVFVAYCQFRAIGDSNGAAERAASAALASASAAEAANRVTEAQLRARLEIEVKNAGPLVAGERIAFTVEALNDGATPARHIAMRFSSHQGPQLPDGDMPIEGLLEGGRLDPLAKQEWTLIGPELSPAFVEQFFSYKATMFFFGRAEYETLGQKRFVEFCWKLGGPPRRSAASQGTVGVFVSCPKWNRAD